MTEEEKIQARKDGLTDEQIAEVEAKRKRDAQEAWNKIQYVADKCAQRMRTAKRKFDDLTNEEVYQAHARLLMYIANNVCLASQHRKYEVDEYNSKVLRFLLYYFNNCSLAETVFPEKDYKLHKNLLLMGKAGTGKTLMMQIFAEYLRATNNPNAFQDVSVTQMTNYFTMHNNIDLYTYNEADTKAWEGRPHNVCLNDIGVENRPFYGIDTRTIVCDFLHARNEIWQQSVYSPDQSKFAHLTTNLTQKKLLEVFSDEFGRLTDRFKTYNIITLQGDSRR